MTRTPDRIVLSLCALVAGFVAMALPAGAASLPILHLEPAETSVAFQLGSTFHEVHGSMAVTGGEVRFDPETGDIEGRIIIDATSANTENKKRDRKMHRQVLESETYPQIVFLPRRYEGSLVEGTETEIFISGAIEIHGASHEVRFPARVHSTEDAIRGTGRLVVPYVEWGMKDPSVLMFRAGKEVAIDISFAGRVDGTDTPWLSEPPRADR